MTAMNASATTPIATSQKPMARVILPIPPAVLPPGAGILLEAARSATPHER